MKILLIAALLLVVPISKAASQQISGPIAVKSFVNGVPITIHATYLLTVKSVGDPVVVNTRILADLIDLQRKFSSVVNTYTLPANGCANRHRNNQSPIAVLKSGSLWPLDEQLMVSISGHIDVWSCIPGRQKSVIRWRKRKIAFFRIKVPRIVTWHDVIEKKVGSQPFYGSLGISFREKSSEPISLKAERPKIFLEGHERLVSDGNLRDSVREIRQKVCNVFQHAINLKVLKQILPTELRESNMKVISTRFRNLGGHTIADVSLDARIQENSERRRLQQLIAQLTD